MTATLSLSPPPAGVLAYENAAVLDRYQRDHGGTSHHARACFRSLLQFLVVCGQLEGKKVPSHEIDDMWHTFLLFTREYAAFCDTHFGRFLHHSPQGDLPAGAYERTREAALTLFGVLDPAFWPAERAADCGSGSSCCD